MQRVDQHVVRTEHERELAGNADGVLEAEQVIEFAVAGTVIGAAVEQMHLLMERAAKGDVQFLNAAADGQQRHAAAKCLECEGEGGSVPVGVVHGGRERRIGTVARRVDVAGAAGEEQAVKTVQHVEHDFAHGRKQDRDRTGGADQGVAVACRRGMLGLTVDDLGAGGNADDDGHVQ